MPLVTNIVLNRKEEDMQTTQQYLTADRRGILSVYTDLPYCVEARLDRGDVVDFCLERDVVRKLWEQLQEWLERDDK
jgi:hypothetical protein